jgi:hypothetical protein
MDNLSETIRDLVSLAGSYRPGVILEAEQVVDTYLAAFRGYRARRAAIDALLAKLACPTLRASNRGGLFEQVEIHLQRRYREMARFFQ